MFQSLQTVIARSRFLLVAVMGGLVAATIMVWLMSPSGLSAVAVAGGDDGVLAASQRALSPALPKAPAVFLQAPPAVAQGGHLSYTVYVTGGNNGVDVLLVTGVPTGTEILSDSVTSPAVYSATFSYDGHQFGRAVYWQGHLSATVAHSFSFGVSAPPVITGVRPISNQVALYKLPRLSTAISDTAESVALGIPHPVTVFTSSEAALGFPLLLRASTNQDPYISTWQWSVGGEVISTSQGAYTHTVAAAETLTVVVTATNQAALQGAGQLVVEIAPAKMLLPMVLRDYCARAWSEPNDNWTESSSLAPAVTFQANFCPDDSDDWYQIEVEQAGVPLRVDLSRVPGNTDLDLYLYDDQLQLKARSDSGLNGVNEQLIFTPDGTGTFYLRVYPYEKGSDAGQWYQLYWAPIG